MLVELRAALRTLTREPGVTSILVLTLALGIGSVTAIFSVADAVMLRPLPFSEPDRLVRVLSRNSFPDIVDWIENTTSFETFGGYNAWSVDLMMSGEPERLAAGLVTGELLPLLGVAPLSGRVIGPGDNWEGGPAVAVASYGFWQNRLGGSDSAIGTSVTLSGRPFSLIGIMPKGFRLPGVDAELIVPHRIVSPETATARGVHFLIAIGRLRPQVSLEAAQADLDRVAIRLEELYPEENTGRRFVLEPWKHQLASSARPALFLLLGFVGIVLLIACANASGLLLARAARRRREVALRSALGADSVRILRIHLVEATLLALISGIVGMLVALTLLRLFLGLAPEGVPRIHEVAMDLRVVGFALTLSLFSGVVFGVVPAMRAVQVPPAESFGAAGARISLSSTRLRSALIVAEVAMATVLLVGAGLLLRSFQRISTVEPGFHAEGLLTMHLNLPLPEYRDIPRRILFFEEALRSMAALPSVEGVAATSDLPFGDGGVPHNLALEDKPVPEGAEPDINYRGISPDYFRVMGIPLVAGRAFSPYDRNDSLPVAVVNEAFVRTLMEGVSPLGKRLRWARREEVRWITIVGVAGDIKPGALDRDEVPAVYVPFTQEQDWWRSWMNIVVRTSLPPENLVASVRSTFAAMAPTIPVAELEPMSARLDRSLNERRFHLLMLSTFSLSALILAAIGLYGLLWYLVVERRRELGIRLALGAPRGKVITLVLRQGVALTATGLLVGAVSAYLLSGAVSGFLFEVSPFDLATFGAITIVLAGASIAASFLPAYRSTKVDPLTAIRYD